MAEAHHGGSGPEGGGLAKNGGGNDSGGAGSGGLESRVVTAGSEGNQH